jgi:hypothetical protein
MSAPPCQFAKIQCREAVSVELRKEPTVARLVLEDVAMYPETPQFGVKQ